MDKKKSKKNVVRIVVLAGAAVLVIGGGSAVIRGRMRKVKADSAAADTMRSYEVKTGTISTTVSGTGTLTADDVETLDLLSLVEVDSVYVKAGDTVQEGDLLASVDAVSVKTALKVLQEEMDDLDEEIEDEQGETISSSVKSGVTGRVKKIYASADEKVTDVMAENGALLLLSLDGKMAVQVSASSDISLGDEVTVILSDGTEEEGTVESIQAGKAIITVTDNGPAYEEEVTITKDGKELGSGKLYIHSELAVTGYTGTISKVSVKENSKVSDGTVLFKLKELGHTSTYEKLVAERAEVAEALGQVVSLYNDPNIYADFSGTVQSVNCEDAEYVELETKETDETKENPTETETTDMQRNQQEAKDSEQAADKNGKKEGSSAEGVNRTGVTNTSGGIIRLGMADTSAAYQVIRTSASDLKGEELLSETGDDQDTMDTSAGTDASDSEEGSDSDGSGSSTDTGSETEAQKEAIAALQPITIITPVTQEAVQTAVSDAAQYSASIGWNPAVTGTYGADTAYTATVILKARTGYYFDGKQLSAYIKAITAQDASLDLNISEDQMTLTITAVFPSTEAKTAFENTDTQTAGKDETAQSETKTQMPAAASGSAAFSAGAAKTVSAGYSMSPASAASDSAESQEEKQDTCTDTTSVFTVSRDEKMSVTLSVDEQDILSLSKGQTAQVTLDAIDGETFEGIVNSVNTLTENTSNGVTKYTAEVLIDKTEDMLQGMNASVVVTVSSSENCLMIPEAALNEKGNTTTVYTTYDEGTGEYGGETEVNTGVSDGTSVEILSGLAEGDTVYYSYTENSSSGFGFNFGGGGMMPSGNGDQMMPGGDRQQMKGSGNGGGMPSMPKQ